MLEIIQTLVNQALAQGKTVKCAETVKLACRDSGWSIDNCRDFMVFPIGY